MEDSTMTIQQFGTQVKTKYPAYGQYSDEEIGNRMLQKYPVYNNRIASAIPTMSASQTADIETAKKYGSTFTPNTENQGFGIGEAAKALGNMPKSVFNFAKGAIDTINPISTFGKVKQAVSEFKGLAGEAGGYGNALVALGKGLPQASYEGLVPEAGRGVIKGVGGLITGNAQKEKEGFETAQRAVTADPFGQVAPFVFGARGLASMADSFANKASMADYVKNIETNIAGEKPIPQPVNTFGNMFDTGISKIASPVLNTITGAFGKVADITGKGVKFGVGQEFGLEPKTVSRIIEKPEAFAPETRGAFTREALGSKVEDALAKRTARLGITPESLAQEIEIGLANKNAKLGITPEILGQEIQSALNTRASALSETGAAYGPIRESKTAIKVSPNWIDSTIKDLTGLTIKKGIVETSGSAILRDSSDVRAMQNLYDVWKPEFKKGKLTTNEFLNFRTDLAKISKFERQIGKSQPLESMAKLARGRFNESYRPQLTGLEAIDKEFSAQTKSLREFSKGLVDKNGKLTDTGLAKIAKTTKEKPNIAKQLEEISPGIIKKIEALNEQKTLGKGIIDEAGNITDKGIRQIVNADPQIQPALLKRLEAISPGITKKITALKEIKQLGKGLIDDSGNITDVGMGRIANAINESNPLMLQRLEKLVPGIAEEIKNYKAASDIEAARGNKVGTYSRSTIGAGAYYLLAHDPFVAVGLWIISKYFLTNSDVGVWMLRKYGSIKSGTIVNLIRSVGSTINQSPNKLPEFLKRDITKIKIPAGLSIEDVSKGKPPTGAFSPKGQGEAATPSKTAATFETGQSLKTPVIRQAQKGFENTDTFRGGTWYSTLESKNYDFGKGFKTDEGAFIVGGSKIIKQTLDVKNPLVIKNAVLEDGSFSVVNSGYENFIPKEYAKRSDSFYTKYRDLQDNSIDSADVTKLVTKTLTENGNTPAQIKSVLKSTNLGDATQDLIVSKGLEKAGYDALVLENNVRGNVVDRHIFKIGGQSQPLDPFEYAKRPDYAKELKTSLGNKSTIESHQEQFYAQPKNMKQDVYYHYSPDGKLNAADLMKGSAERFDKQLGPGLYVGQDAGALQEFYGLDVRGGRTIKLTGNPKILDLTDSFKAIDDVVKEAKKTFPNEKYPLKSWVQQQGYDGLKYFDPIATGEEYVIYNPKALAPKSNFGK